MQIGRHVTPQVLNSNYNLIKAMIIRLEKKDTALYIKSTL